jgi:fructose-specific component phosphotransferase system IIB-like protein
MLTYQVAAEAVAALDIIQVIIEMTALIQQEAQVQQVKFLMAKHCIGAVAEVQDLTYHQVVQALEALVVAVVVEHITVDLLCHQIFLDF